MSRFVLTRSQAEQQCLNKLSSVSILSYLPTSEVTTNVLIAFLGLTQPIVDMAENVVPYLINSRKLNCNALAYIFFDLKQVYSIYRASKHCTPRMFDFVLSGRNNKKFLKENTVDYYAAALENPLCPQHFLAQDIASNKQKFVYYHYALRNPNCPQEMLEARFVGNQRKSILCNSRCPLSVFQQWLIEFQQYSNIA